MPQMAPISWLILFFIFSLSFIMFNVLNYFCFNKNNLNSNNNNTKKMNNTTLNWKW